MNNVPTTPLPATLLTVFQHARLALAMALASLPLLTAATSAATPPDEVGKALYQLHCAACHGAEGGGGQGVSLTDTAWLHGSDDASIAASISQGFAEQGMPGFAALLTAAQIDLLVDHLKQLKPAAAAQVVNNPLAVPGPGFPKTTIHSEVHDFRVESIVRLTPGYALASLPDGRILVTEVSGALRIIDNGRLLESPIAGTPTGKPTMGFRRALMDVVVHPDYSSNGWIYLGSVDAGGEGGLDELTISRGRIRDGRWVDGETLFTMESTGSAARMAFGADNSLFITTSIMSQPPVSDPDFGHPDAGKSQAQDLSSLHGKVLRLNDDGTVPKDNPFTSQKNANPAIWSYGHRALLGMTFDQAGNLWATENGPRGGDELNRIQSGKNYGWPLVTWGHRYDDKPASLATVQDGLELPVISWVPSIAPSAITLYQGEAFPRWRGNLLMGSLRQRDLYRLVLDGTDVVLSERILRNVERIRDVEIGMDGNVYLLTDAGEIVRLVPR